MAATNPINIDLSTPGKGVELELGMFEKKAGGFFATAEQFNNMPECIGDGLKSDLAPVRTIIVNCGEDGVKTIYVYARLHKMLEFHNS